MIPKIKEVKALPNYKLYVKFERTMARLFDLKPYLSKGIFKELRDEKYFQKVRVVWGGVEWPHQQDLSAETLFHKGISTKQRWS